MRPRCRGTRQHAENNGTWLGPFSGSAAVVSVAFSGGNGGAFSDGSARMRRFAILLSGVISNTAVSSMPEG